MREEEACLTVAGKSGRRRMDTEKIGVYRESALRGNELELAEETRKSLNKGVKQIEKRMEIAKERPGRRMENDCLAADERQQGERVSTRSEPGGATETRKEMRYDRDLTVLAEVVGEEKVKTMELLRAMRDVCGGIVALRETGPNKYEVTVKSEAGKKRLLDGFKVGEGEGEVDRDSISDDEWSNVRPAEEPALGSETESGNELGDEVVSQSADLLVQEGIRNEGVDELGSSMDHVLADWSGDAASRPEGGWLGSPRPEPNEPHSQNEIESTTRIPTSDVALLAPQASSVDSDLEMDVQWVKRVRKRAQQGKPSGTEGGYRNK
ncbi:hypothetical protein Q8A73_024603, partial [Channa argus]